MTGRMLLDRLKELSPEELDYDICFEIGVPHPYLDGQDTIETRYPDQIDIGCGDITFS